MLVLDFRFVNLRQSEIKNFRASVGGYHNIARFYITMNDAFFVGVSECAGDVNKPFEKYFQIKTAFADKIVERFSFDIFHCKKRLSANFFERVNRRDIRMIERGDGAGFNLETTQIIRVIDKRNGQRFERDDATEPNIFRQINFAHSADADARNNFIIPENFPR